MRRSRIVSVATAAAGLVAAHASSALASACDREVVARIKTPPGQTCWTYRGAATTFVGDFAHGQTIFAQMTGQSAEMDPRSGQVVTSWSPRDPNVEGPGGFFSGNAQAPGSLTFIAPANGTYRFSFSPCAMWGGQGVVKICAK
ncbi:hypothetical protein [Roseiarcus sp.]|uniref:hypothetical protein n=1 Tax=Roseiarcus sp. TaxID=1969460 RepID=UPI003F9879AC